MDEMLSDQVVVLPIYNGTYFNALFKTASKLQELTNYRFIFFFGQEYPGRGKHEEVLKGRFKYISHHDSWICKSAKLRFVRLIRKFPLIDEVVSFLETLARVVNLNFLLRKIWKMNNIRLFILPADNRYFYPFIVKFCKQRSCPVIVMPQWFAGHLELEQSFAHSKIYKPGALRRRIIRLISEKYLRPASFQTLEFQMIPIRFSEILLRWLYKVKSPDPWILHSGESDRIFVETKETFEFAKKLGFGENQLVLTGSVYLDEMNLYVSEPENQIELLVAVAPDMFASRHHANLEFANYKDYLIFLCESLLHSGYSEATFSMHPSDAGNWTNLVSAFGFSITEKPLHLILPRSKVFLATVSSTIQWAVYLKVPTVNFDFYRYNYPDYSNLGDVVYVQGKNDLVPALYSASQINSLKRGQNSPKEKFVDESKEPSINTILAEINILVR